MDRSETQVRDWVDGVGNEVVLSGGLLSAFVILLIAVYVLSDGRRFLNHRHCTFLLVMPPPAHIYRRDVHPERAASVMATRMELAREGRQGAGQRGGVGDSAEPHSCPICLSHLSFPVDTNCGHTFCAECILSYWQHDQWPRPARCAVCRRQASSLTSPQPYYI